jgi:hypothetical protein
MAKPRTMAGYDKAQVARVRATSLYIATKLGDLLDQLVIVGGLVPSLLIDQRQAREKHIGTLDLDIGMEVAILDGRRYEALTERLRAAGFEPDKNEKGKLTRQRWKIDGPPKVTVDFLIPPSRQGDRGGQLRNIEADFAAIIAPGLRLAFIDQLNLTLEGTTIRGEEARRVFAVCGPGAFVVMKALAFRSRGENKDAYDLVYLLQNYGEGLLDVLRALTPILSEPEAKEALRFLAEDFKTVESTGPIRAAEFLHGTRNEDAEADAWRALSGICWTAYLSKILNLTKRSGRLFYAGVSGSMAQMRRGLQVIERVGGAFPQPCALRSSPSQSAGISARAVLDASRWGRQ